MRIRRIKACEGMDSLLETSEDEQWRVTEPNDASLGWLRELAPRDDDPANGLLPFQPRSFRDCMLYEQHWIDASRGYVRRFMPAVYPITRLFEAITRRPFPAFRPDALSRKQPTYYFGNHMTMVPSGTVIDVRGYTQALDFELELGWVLKKPLFNATPEEAVHAIGGFVVVNDFSARDLQRAEMSSSFGPQKSKHFLSSMSLTMATPESLLSRIHALSASVEINGRKLSQTSTAGMRYSLGQVLSHLSRGERLYPGELIASGTLPGGCGMEKGRWLQSGDQLRLVIEDVGEITHNIE